MILILVPDTFVTENISLLPGVATVEVTVQTKLALEVNAAGAVKVTPTDEAFGNVAIPVTICALVCCVPAALYVVGTAVRLATGVVLVMLNGAVPVAKVEVSLPAAETFQLVELMATVLLPPPMATAPVVVPVPMLV